MPWPIPPNPTEKHTVEFQFQFDWQAAINSIPYLAKGIPYTLMISFGGLAIGFVLVHAPAAKVSSWLPMTL